MKCCEVCQQKYPEEQYTNRKNKGECFPWCFGCRRADPVSWQRRYQRYRQHMVCEACGQDLPKTHFKNPQKKTVFLPWCRICRRADPVSWQREQQKRYRNANPSRMRMLKRNYYNRHKMRILAQQKMARQEKKTRPQSTEKGEKGVS